MSISNCSMKQLVLHLSHYAMLVAGRYIELPSVLIDDFTATDKLRVIAQPRLWHQAPGLLEIVH